MRVIVHVREKAIPVQCGEGSQRIKWLGHVGIARYEASIELGVPKLVKTEGGNVLEMNAIIKDTLKDEQHVWVTSSADESQRPQSTP
eukprot:m51a1_g7175 hypothetical protein (87) ;mRNA; r:71918-72539